MSGKNAKTRALVPTSTRTQARVVLFQPSQRPGRRTGDWQVTSWGRVRVSGRLGQRHADTLEAICWTAIARRDIEDGGIELLVDPHSVRRVMTTGGPGPQEEKADPDPGQKKKKKGPPRYSSEQLHVLLADLRAAVIEIETPELARDGQRIIGGLLDHWIPSRRAVMDPLTGGVRQLWRVRLGVALMALIRQDAAIWRDPAPIARLGSGVSQALARHILTHRAAPRGGWRLDGLLDAVGARADGRARRVARQAVRADAAGLAELGIAIEGDRVRRVEGGGAEGAP